MASSTSQGWRVNAHLVVVPQHELAFVVYGNSNAAIAIIDRLSSWVLRDYLGIAEPEVVTRTIEAPDLEGFAGTYRSNQFRVDVRVVDGQLEETMQYEPFDDTQARILRGFTGGIMPFPPHRLAPVGERLFAPASPAPETRNPRVRRVLLAFGGARPDASRREGVIL
jgi:hypothetical protein